MLKSSCAIKPMAGLIGCAVSLISPYLFPAGGKQIRRFSDDIEPFVRHKTLNPIDFCGKDLLIIGDIHGCFTELQHLLNVVESKTDKPFFKIFVGDMINKGPKSEAVLNFLTQEKDVRCVRGNHEQKVLLEYFDLKNTKIPVPENKLWVKNLKKSYVDYIKNLPYTISIPWLNIIVVHAGLIPGVPLTEQDPNSMLNMRNLYWDDDDFHGQVLKSTYLTDNGNPWSQLWRGPEHVYFGHDAVRKLQQNTHSTGLDTGCVYGGELTAVLLRLNSQNKIVDREFFHVRPKKVYVAVVD